MKEQNNFYMQFSMQINKLWKNFFLLIVFFAYLFLNSNAMASREAPYKVVHENDIYEVRHYSDRLVIEVIQVNDNRSFRQLFNYIAGENSNTEKIEMTTPVTQTKKDNKSFMQFFLPPRFSKENVPTPNNPNIKIDTIEEGYFAVIKYSGRLTEKNFEKHVKILKQKLFEDKVSIIGTPIRATYNGPFTLPSLRRNEVMFSVDWKNN